METVASAITIIIGVLVTVFAGTAALFGALGGIKRSGVNLVCMLISVILAFFVAAPASQTLAQKLEPVVGTMSDEIAEELPTLAALFDGTLCALLTPAVFGALFAIFAIVFAVIGAVVSRCVFGRNEWDRGAVSRICGLGVGMISGFLVISVMLIPISGYAALAFDTACVLEDEGEITYALGDEEDIDPSFGYGEISVSSAVGEMRGAIENVTPIFSPLCRRGYMRFIAAAGGNALFDLLCRVDADGYREPLSDLLPRTARLLVDVLPLAETSPQNYGEAQCAAMDVLASDMEDDELAGAVIAEALAGASQAWLDGREFLGVECPDIDARLRPVAEALMRSLCGCDSTLLRANIRPLTEIAKLLINNKDVFAEDGDIMNTILAGQLALELLDIADGSELLRSASEAAKSAGVEYVGDALGLTEDETASAEELAGKIAESVSRALANEDESAAVEDLCEDIKKTAEDYGIEISEELLQIAGDYMLNTFESMSRVTAEDIFAMFAAAVPRAEN